LQTGDNSRARSENLRSAYGSFNFREQRYAKEPFSTSIKEREVSKIPDTERAGADGADGMFLASMADLPMNYQRMLDQNIDFM
jgi:hypothetical protein